VLLGKANALFEAGGLTPKEAAGLIAAVEAGAPELPDLICKVLA
jgi:hypothetical protein